MTIQQLWDIIQIKQRADEAVCLNPSGVGFAGNLIIHHSVFFVNWNLQSERGVRKVNNLENYRKKAGLTQAELSKMTGIPECAISRVEKSVSDMNGARWKAVAEALGCSIDELLRVNRN